MNNENKKKEQEEIDLIVLLNKLKHLFLSIVLFLFRAAKNFFSNWRTIAGIIVVGAVIGLIAESVVEEESSKEASVLLRINFDAGNYVYDAINLINQKIEAEDEDFFTNEMKFNEDEALEEISIKPIIDLKDILKDDINANEIRTLFENLEFEDNLAMSIARGPVDTFGTLTGGFGGAISVGMGIRYKRVLERNSNTKIASVRRAFGSHGKIIVDINASTFNSGSLTSRPLSFLSTTVTSIEASDPNLFLTNS